MEYWVRAIFLERKFTIESVIPGAPESGIFLLDRHDGEPPDYLLK